MTTRMNMFDGPLTGRIATGFDTPAFSAQTVPAEFAPLPPMDRPDPVGHLMGVPKPQSAKDALARVTKLLGDVEAGPERDGLLLEWAKLSGRVEAFLAESKERHAADLRQQIAELRPQCRASLDRVRQQIAELHGLDGRLHAAEEPYGKANLALRVALNSKPDDEAFPSDEEIAEWRASVAKAQSAADRESGRVDRLRELIAAKDAEIRAETKQLNELKLRREDCRAELEGRARKGPFGLMVPGV